MAVDQYTDPEQLKRQALLSQMPGGTATAPDSGNVPPLITDEKAQAPAFSTRLMEGDSNKLGNLEHMAKSPKYQFLTMAQSGKYNYDQLGDMLKDLQGGQYGQDWQGWSANGDKLRFTGDPSQLSSKFDGVRDIDAIGAYGNFGKPDQGEVGGWRWGAEDPNAPAQGTAQPQMMDLLNKGVPTDNGFLQKLIEQARGFAGPASTDRNALLSLMS